MSRAHRICSMEAFDCYSALLSLGMPPCLPKPRNAKAEAPSGWHWSQLADLSPDVARHVLESHALQWFVREFGFCSVVRMGDKICFQTIRPRGSLPSPKATRRTGRPLRLGELLMERGLLLEDELEQALRRHRETGKRLGEVLLQDNIMEPDALLPVLGEQLGVPHVIARALRQQATPETAANLPEMTCRRSRLVCWACQDEVLAIAMADPTDVIALDTVKAFTGKQIRPHLADPVAIEETINRCFAGRDHAQTVPSDESVELKAKVDISTPAPVIKYVDAIIREALTQNATAIRIEPRPNEVVAEFCVDGHWSSVPPPPKRLVDAVTSRFKLLSGWQGNEAPETEGPEHLLDGRRVAMRLTVQKGLHGDGFEVSLLSLKDATSKPPSKWLGRDVPSSAPVTGRGDTLLDAIVEVARLIRGDTEEGTGIHAGIPA